MKIQKNVLSKSQKYMNQVYFKRHPFWKLCTFHFTLLLLTWFDHLIWGLSKTPISNDFSPSKMAYLMVFFFKIFANWDLLLRVFLLQNGWFYFFFNMKWDPLLRKFLTKMEPMSEDFWWKSNPFGGHIPICLSIWEPQHLMGTCYTRRKKSTSYIMQHTMYATVWCFCRGI